MVESSIASVAKWAWHVYGNDVKQWTQEKSQVVFEKAWKQFKWDKAEYDYKQRLAELHGQTRILGNSRPTSLKDIFTHLYILDRPLALRRYDLQTLQNSDEKLRGHDVKRCNGVELIKRDASQRLFILGKPGAGKTTFLKYITLQAMQPRRLGYMLFVTQHFTQ